MAFSSEGTFIWHTYSEKDLSLYRLLKAPTVEFEPMHNQIFAPLL
jgi:hypothetical protein